MIEVRMLGRGGQGAYSSAEMLASALVKEGKYATCFPMFGGERRGAPVNVFLRFDDKPIRLRSQIYYPDCCVVTDPLRARTPDALKGLKPGSNIRVQDIKRRIIEAGGKKDRQADKNGSQTA